MKFNILKKVKEQIKNLEGAPAFSLNPELELYSAVVTSSLSDTFYESGDKRLKRIQELINQCSPVFVAKLAIYARREMHLRSIPLVLIVELVKSGKSTISIANAINKIVNRADEITELLAYYQIANKRQGVKKLNRLSKQVQKGLALAFNKFDEYQFAKYNRATEIKLRDALFLVHPKPKNEAQQLLFNKIAQNTLAIPYTWETELSVLGSQNFSNEYEKKIAFRDKWEELIDSGKMGYMATLRNLRNILQAEVRGIYIEKLANYIRDEKAVLQSKQLPFRFLSAYRELKELKYAWTAVILDALEDAVMISARNIAGFDEKTKVVIACDVSGSMQQSISKNSKVMLYDIGLMLGMLMQSRCKQVLSGMFGDTWKAINMSQRNVLGNVMEYYRREGEVGYSTNGYLIIEDLIKRNEIVDKVMVFTDVQLWDSSGYGKSMSRMWNNYKNIAPQSKLYLFDLAGYGHTPVKMNAKDVFLIAGWSDKVFDILNSLALGREALSQIKEIEI